MTRWLVGAAFLILSLGVGALTILTAVGVIPADDADLGAPRWLATLVGAVFVAMGLYVGLAGRTTEAQRGLLGGAFALLFFTTASVFLTWAVLTGAEAGGTLSVAGLPVPLPQSWERVVSRVFVAFCAVLMNTVTVISWWVMGRHAWRSLVPPPPP